MMANSGYEKCAHLYDLFDTKKNIEFFLRYVSEAGEVLDIGAGTGRIAVTLAERGVKVFCVEPSPAMRREFEKKLSARPELSQNIELVAGDATSFKFPRTFPAAFLSGVFDHFLDDKERLAALRNIAKHLETHGQLIFEVGLGYMKDSPMSPAGKVTEGDKEYRRFLEGKVLPDEKMEWLLVYEIYQSGKLVEKIEERSLAGIIDRAKLHRLLKETGFEVKREFGGHDFKMYKEGDLLLIVEAHRL
ncbi:MAG: methyltransferase domain-containing protein [Candidatus Zixiibacteriota bacterium]